MQAPSALRMLSPRQVLAAKIVVFAISLLPLAWWIWGFNRDLLGANPVETITHGTGDWCLRFLLITLAVTPMRKLTGMHWLLRLRRMLGLFAFFYGSLHLTTYLWLDQFFDWNAILKDIVKRPFITLGFAAYILMAPLALTSFDAAIRWLGARNWQRLHRAVYAVAILGVLHFWWLVKRDLTEPIIYAVLLGGLFAARWHYRKT
ncbi:MAG: protein-methionine-sulfoxide reductase heme-binding subunit MsrQ [Moraxellaceae bacterium]|nr:protein-methionine-sulfoxide reductase heme-binding subunit MsrQ [Moraxellaceae bacterium]